MIGIIHGINNIFNLYLYLIILRIFLTWVPSIQWGSQPWKTIREVTDIYLDLFRKIIPPFHGLDFSPIIALFALQIVQKFVVYILAKLLLV